VNRDSESEGTVRLLDTRTIVEENHHGIMTHPVRARGRLERTPSRAHTPSVPSPHISRHRHMGVGIPEPPADPWGVRVQIDGDIQIRVS